MTKKIPLSAPADRGEWFKSSYSNASGSCVETRLTATAALVRDSKDRRAEQPFLTLTRTAWTSFLRTVMPEDA